MTQHEVFDLPHRVTVDIDIDAPADQVFGYVTDPQNQVHWIQAASDVHDVEGPPGVGQRYSVHAHFLGKKFEQTEEVTEFEPNARYAWRTVTGPVHDVHYFEFEEKNGGTKVTVNLGVRDLRFLGKLAEPLIVRSARRHQQHSLETLKDLLETHGPEHPR